jgi:hypothetical protein
MKEIGSRQRRVIEALEGAGGELPLSDLRRALPDMRRQDVHAAVATLESRDVAETRYEGREKIISYVFPERTMQMLVESGHPTGERTPHEWHLDSDEEQGFDYVDDELLLALPWTAEDEQERIYRRIESDALRERGRDREEQEQREAEYQRELEEGPRVWTSEEIQEDVRQMLARPIPDPDESAARAEREFVPLTEEQARALFEGAHD